MEPYRLWQVYRNRSPLLYWFRIKYITVLEIIKESRALVSLHGGTAGSGNVCKLGSTGAWLEMRLNYFIATEGCEAEQKVKQAALILFAKKVKRKE